MNSTISSIIKTIRNPRISFLPKSMALDFLMALIPSLSLVMFSVQLFQIPVESLEEVLLITLPEQTAEVLASYIKNYQLVASPITIFLLVISLNIVANGVVYLIHVLNRLFAPVQTNQVAIYVRAYLATIATVLFVAVFLFLFTFYPQFVALITIPYFTFPFFWLMLFIILSLMFCNLPCKRLKWKDTFLGALLSSCLMSLFVSLLTIINFITRNYQDLYGPISWVIAVLFSLQLVAWFLYLGIVINHVLYRKKLSREI